ncbi:amino acid permease 3 [Prunus dulcis]|uniref:Amino acid permease 3 n=1 Tax=Prunus dulcis TaxID=3755 RepID=A0A4Y1QUQ3_PRUDU|nr:amino acid permease 3 [Prunus dulcis]
MAKMGDNQLTHHQVFDVSVDVPPEGGSKCFDDDGRLKRTGTVWTASAHIITAVIGSGVLSLAWATAQLGWVAGPSVMLLFSFVTYYTSTLLAACYRTGDPVTGKRNYTYTDAVRSNLGGFKEKICGFVQYLNLFGVAIGYTIASSISMVAIKRSNCFYKNGDTAPCHVNSNPYMIAFGIAEIIFSQIPNFDQLWWLSIVAAVMSFTYSSIGLGLGIAKVVETGTIRGSMTGISIEMSFQALGDIAFAYSYSLILIEIQDTVKSPPSEAKTMKKATIVSVATTTLFYMLCGCMGYAAFGDSSPGNLLTGFGFFNPIGSLTLPMQPLSSTLLALTKSLSSPSMHLLRKQQQKSTHIAISSQKTLNSESPALVSSISTSSDWCGGHVFLLPCGDVYCNKGIPKWSTRWICLQILSGACLIVTIAAAAGSIAGVISDLKIYKPFKTSY